jgi:hypothetical protein
VRFAEMKIQRASCAKREQGLRGNRGSRNFGHLGVTPGAIN